MDLQEEYTAHLRRLMRLLEEDQHQISQAFQGEILDAYQEAIKKEMNELSQTIHSLYTQV